MSELTNGLVPQLQAEIESLRARLEISALREPEYQKFMIEKDARIAELEAEKARLLSACMKAQQKLVGDDEIGAYKTLREVTALKPAPVADAPVQDEQGGDHWWRFTDTNALDKALAVAKPAPRFKVGDKVLAAKLVVPLPVTKLVWYRGEWCYELDNRAVFWRDYELEAYSESEGE